MPTWRRDIAIEADVAEEIARVRGYELVPSVTPDTAMPVFRASPLEIRELVRETLAGAGLTEVVTTALVSPRHIETFVLSREVPSTGDEPQPGGDPIGVTNPLSRDHSLLRRNLLGSLLDVVGVNLRHGTEDVAIFEIGKGYAHTGSEPREWWRLGFALVGAAEPAAWNRTARPYDLDDAKGILELLARRLGLPAIAYAAETGEALFHPGRAPGRTPAIACTRWSARCTRTIVDTWELRTTQRVILAEVAIDGLAAGRARAGARPRRAALPGGRARPRDHRSRGRPCRRRGEPRSRARRRPAARRAAVRHLPRGAAGGRGEEPRVPGPLRRRGQDAAPRPRSRRPSPASWEPCRRSEAVSGPEVTGPPTGYQ